MIKVMMVATMAVVISGCTVIDRPVLVYTQAEVDAIAARNACRSLARSLVQIYRCEGR